jgi:hypothetical protein
MDVVTVLLALFEFALTVLLTVGVIYANYRLYIVTNSDYDAEEEMRKNNVGVAVLLAAMLVSGGAIVKQGIYPVVNLVRLHLTSPTLELGTLELLAMVVGHIALVFGVAVFSISLSLRFWGRLTRNVEEGKELARGNAAVGVVLAGVVLVMGMFVSEGVSRLTKSLIPQAPLGQVMVAP